MILILYNGNRAAIKFGGALKIYCSPVAAINHLFLDKSHCLSSTRR